jgi:hypothetical protein
MPKTVSPLIILDIGEQKLVDIVDISGPAFSLNIHR